MKKITVILMIFAMLLSLCACSGGNDKGYDKKADLFSQADKLNKNDLTADEVKDIEERAVLDGYTLLWKEDGSLLLEVSEDIQYLDGEWPMSRFTKLFREPKDGFISEVQVHGNTCRIMMQWSAEQARDYAATYKKDFSNKSEETNSVITGVYTFYGVNGDGVELHITRSPSTGMISITMPEK